MAKSNIAHNIAYLYVSLAILLWASTAAVAKLMVKNLDNFQVMFYSFIFAVISLFIIAVWQKKLHLIKKYKTKDYLIFLGMGGVGIFLYYVFYYGAFMKLPAQEVTIVNDLWPIMIIIFAMIILRERFTFFKILGVIVSFFGVYVVISHGNLLGLKFSNALGVFFALMCAVTCGLFSVLGKKLKYDDTIAMLLYYLVAFILTIPAVLIFSSFKMPTPIEWLGLFWLGAATSGIAYLVWFMALKKGDTAIMSNLIYITPFIGLVFIYLFVGEKILLSSLVGLIIVVGGICLQFVKVSKSAKKVRK